MNDIERHNWWHLEMDAFLKKKKEDEPEEVVGHVCRYCGNVEMQINNHFAHIEFFHPDKPLI